MKPTNAELENRFRHHVPDIIAQSLHAQVRRGYICPDGRNLSLALTALEDVRMRANAAIACDRGTL